MKRLANLDAQLNEALKKFINTHSYEIKELIMSWCRRDAKFYERTAEDILSKQILQDIEKYIQESDDYADILLDILSDSYEDKIVDTIIEDAYLSINLSEQMPLLISLVEDLKNR